MVFCATFKYDILWSLLCAELEILAEKFELKNLVVGFSDVLCP